MKLAIMQPYFFPYIGYFQLIQAADKMILYDLVTYRKASWINRNRLIDRSKKAITSFGVPVQKFRFGTLVRDIRINQTTDWPAYIGRLIYYNYKKAPQFDTVYPLVKELLTFETDSIHEFNSNAIKQLASFINIDTEITHENTHYIKLEEELALMELHDLSNVKSRRIIEICRREGSPHYLNPSGGQALYQRSTFLDAQMGLSFVKSGEISYKQFIEPFTPNLSILDVLMHNSKEQVQQYINNYSLV